MENITPYALIQYILAIFLILCAIRYRIKNEKKAEVQMQRRSNTKIAAYDPATLIFYRDGEQVLRSSTLMAVEKPYGTIRYVGEDARPEGIPEEIRGDLIIGSPFRMGTVADFDFAADLMQIYLRYLKYNTIRRPRIAACAPADLTDVETRALRECLFRAGAKDVMILEEPYPSAAERIPPKFRLVIEIIPLSH